jgi:hypothetical protein
MQMQTAEVAVMASVASIMVLGHVFTVSSAVKQPASSLHSDLVYSRMLQGHDLLRRAIPSPQTSIYALHGPVFGLLLI